MSNRTDSTDHRCAICGEVIAPKQKAYSVDRVEYGPRGGVTTHGKWGEAHEECFLRQTGGRAIVPYLKRLAKQPTSRPEGSTP